MKEIKGYKAFNEDMTCRGFQYEVGKEYKIDGNPIICNKGFHFCKSIADCYQFYGMSDKTIICEIKALGEVVTDDDIKFCTNHILIGKRITKAREKSNTNTSSSGYCNSGNRNSGNCNSGNRNSGNCNSGNWNSGDCNSGNCNSGNRNSGNCNSGNWNSGNWNSGNWNSGDCNSGNRNSGIFNTEKNPKIRIFDTVSEWTMIDWLNSKAFTVMSRCPHTYSKFVNNVDMTDEEKEKHPEYKTFGGYIKTYIATETDKQKWWDKLSDIEKQAVYDIPFFDEDKFYQCTGIKVVRNDT